MSVSPATVAITAGLPPFVGDVPVLDAGLPGERLHRVVPGRGLARGRDRDFAAAPLQIIEQLAEVLPGRVRIDPTGATLATSAARQGPQPSSISVSRRFFSLREYRRRFVSRRARNAGTRSVRATGLRRRGRSLMRFPRRVFMSLPKRNERYATSTHRHERGRSLAPARSLCPRSPAERNRCPE
jgi:hypothetical protein